MLWLGKAYLTLRNSLAVPSAALLLAAAWANIRSINKSKYSSISEVEIESEKKVEKRKFIEVNICFK